MKDKVIIISGPTGCGKSSLGIKLASKLKTEIISCDSMQIYRGMDIGTAKVSLEEQKHITHHMIDIIDPNANYSVHDFQKACLNHISDIHEKGKIPILVGGTGLYVNSIFYKYDFSDVKPNYTFREKLEDLYKENPQLLLDKLLSIDKVKYSNLTINDKKKIIRALEVYEFSGKTISVDSQYNDDFDFYLYVLTDDRQKLYDNINVRVDNMLAKGLINEVNTLLNKGLNKDCQSMKAIGYREVIPYIEGEIDYNTMVENLKQDSRRYAKRQLTWFRKNKRAKWLDKSIYTNDQLLNMIIEDINGL